MSQILAICCPKLSSPNKKQSKRVEKNVIQQNILTKIEQRKGKIRYRNTKPNKEESEALKHVRKQDKIKSTKSDGRNSLSL